MRTYLRSEEEMKRSSICGAGKLDWAGAASLFTKDEVNNDKLSNYNTRNDSSRSEFLVRANFLPVYKQTR